MLSEPVAEREEYWPEGEYFVFDDPDAVDFPSRLLTAQVIAGWADSYTAWITGDQFERREGPIPGDADERAALVAELFAWLGGRASASVKPGLNLIAGGDLVLDCYDDERGRLRLTPGEYAALQAAWLRHGLPGNLYYPRRAARVVVEPRERLGRLVLIQRFYSPRAWAQTDRDH
jgi:hypothetical protein